MQEIIVECCETVFDNVTLIEDLTDTYWEASEFGLKIHLPEVLFSDGRINHLLRDLYLFLFFEKTRNGYRVKEYVCRKTLTYQEWRSGFIHSHVSGGNTCLGSGPLRNFISLLDELDEDEDPETTLISFFLNWDSFLKWESRQGGPYKRISNVLNYGSENSARTEGLEDALLILKRTGVTVRIVDKECVVDKAEIRDILLNDFDFKRFLISITSDGVPGKVPPIDIQLFEIERDPPLLSSAISKFFDNQEISVITSDQKLEDGVHPELLNLVCSKLNQKLKTAQYVIEQR